MENQIPSKSINIVMCQFNFTVGDIEGNEKIIRSQIEKYSEDNNSILIFPELALSGYLPLDQLYYSDFLHKVKASIDNIVASSNQNVVIFGSPRKSFDHKTVYNSAYIVQNKKILGIVDKVLLPNYNIFHEKRYFLPGQPKVFELFGLKMGIQVCEDMWDDRPEHTAKVTQIQSDLGAKFFINLSASPYSTRKTIRRLETVNRHVTTTKSDFVYVNCIGSQDEVVFDGRSFIVNRLGNLIYTADKFKEGSYKVEYNIEDRKFVLNDNVLYSNLKEPNTLDDYESAIKLSLLDYLRKNNLQQKVIVALSGGIDSALTATLAQLSLGSKNVIGVYMPSKFSSDHSKSDAKKLSENLNIEFYDFSIEEINALLSNQIHQEFGFGDTWHIADENLQARIRAIIIMYLSNRHNAIVLGTGNKSEIACGYSTLYGDSVGGKNLIGDLFKTEVYQLAIYLNEKYDDLIPLSSIKKVPSAELRENQKDSDSLPDYDKLDPILKLYIEQQQSRSEIVNLGHDAEIVDQVLSLMRKNEFKRYQLCQTVKLKRRTFGIGRIFPITSQFDS